MIRVRTIGFLLAGALVLAGCSGGGDDDQGYAEPRDGFRYWLEVAGPGEDRYTQSRVIESAKNGLHTVTVRSYDGLDLAFKGEELLAYGLFPVSRELPGERETLDLSAEDFAPLFPLEAGNSLTLETTRTLTIEGGPEVPGIPTTIAIRVMEPQTVTVEEATYECFLIEVGILSSDKPEEGRTLCYAPGLGFNLLEVERRASGVVSRVTAEIDGTERAGRE